MPCLIGLLTSIPSCTLHHWGWVHSHVTTLTWCHPYYGAVIGNVGARFQGALHQASHVLQGFWRQSGTLLLARFVKYLGAELDDASLYSVFVTGIFNWRLGINCAPLAIRKARILENNEPLLPLRRVGKLDDMGKAITTCWLHHFVPASFWHWWWTCHVAVCQSYDRSSEVFC